MFLSISLLLLMLTVGDHFCEFLFLKLMLFHLPVKKKNVSQFILNDIISLLY